MALPLSSKERSEFIQQEIKAAFRDGLGDGLPGAIITGLIVGAMSSENWGFITFGSILLLSITYNLGYYSANIRAYLESKRRAE